MNQTQLKWMTLTMMTIVTTVGFWALGERQRNLEANLRSLGDAHNQLVVKHNSLCHLVDHNAAAVALQSMPVSSAPLPAYVGQA